MDRRAQQGLAAQRHSRPKFVSREQSEADADDPYRLSAVRDYLALDEDDQEAVWKSTLDGAKKAPGKWYIYASAMLTRGFELQLVTPEQFKRMLGIMMQKATDVDAIIWIDEKAKIYRLKDDAWNSLVSKRMVAIGANG